MAHGSSQVQKFRGDRSKARCRLPSVGTLWNVVLGTSAPTRRGSTLPMRMYDPLALDPSLAFGEDRDSAAACSAFADVGVGAATEESVP